METEKNLFCNVQQKMIFYFAYGSNMFSDRMKINNPSAIKKTIGKLKGYQLCFQGFADSWKGATATIIENKSYDVWGTVWQLPEDKIINLDRQEGGYNAIQVNVETIDNEELLCRTYQMPKMEQNKPSTVYKAVIIYGANEQNLPSEYVDKLKNIEDNGYISPITIAIDINKVLSSI